MGSALATGLRGWVRKIRRTVGIEMKSRISAGPSVHAISSFKSELTEVGGPASPTRVEKKNTARMNATITTIKIPRSHAVISMNMP